jgi:receptor expression-enhancing protein 5/6
VIYPAAQSIKAIESHSKDDDKEWLTYWIIFGLFTLIDDFFGCILAMIPYFFFIKLGFFVYLFAPQTKGALKIYNTVAQPLLVQYRPMIEQLIKDVQGVAKDAAKEVKKEVVKTAQDPSTLLKAAEFASKAQQMAEKEAPSEE